MRETHFPDWVAWKLGSPWKPRWQKGEHRDGENSHHSKPWRFSATIRPSLSFLPLRLKHRELLSCRGIDFFFFCISCRRRGVGRDHACIVMQQRTSCRIGVNIWFFGHPRAWEEAKLKQKPGIWNTNTYSRWRHYCKQSPRTICEKPSSPLSCPQSLGPQLNLYIKCLISEDFCWFWKRFSAHWTKNFERIPAHVQETGLTRCHFLLKKQEARCWFIWPSLITFSSPLLNLSHHIFPLSALFFFMWESHKWTVKGLLTDSTGEELSRTRG